MPDPSIRLPIRLLTGIGPILKPRDYDALEARLREAADAFEDEGAFPLVAFVIDTVTAAGMIAEDKENDPGAWQAVIDGLKGISQRLNALALPIHHAGKSASAGLRGSSNIRGGADAILMLSCDRDEVTGESRNHFLALSKSRTGVEGPIGEIRHSPVVIGRRQDGSEVTSLVLEIDPGTQLRNRTMAAKPTRATKAFSDALRDAFASESEQVRVHGKHDAPVVAAVRLGHIRDAFARYYATTGDTERRKKDALRKQFKAAFEQALSTRLIYSGAWTETEWVWRAEGNLAGTFTVED